MSRLKSSWLLKQVKRRWKTPEAQSEGFPASYPADLETRFTTKTGRELVIRPIRPDDVGLLRAGFARLSPDTVYRRFHVHLNELSDEACRFLTHVDYTSHLALVAVEPVSGIGVGVARFYRPNGAEHAEAAIVVADDWQGEGVGRFLLDRLAAAARERGIGRFVTFIQHDNRRVLKILRESEYELRSTRRPDALRVEVDLGGSGSDG